MLVCSVSQRARRAAIAADLAETAAALDQPGTGNVVFATLVDDPASVGEIVDAYVGEIMLEAASAADSVDGSVPQVYAVNITEAVNAADVSNASAAVLTTTYDPTTASANVTLSNGNLTATHTNTSGNVGVRSSSLLTAGKYYFEVTIGATHGFSDMVGLIDSVGSYTNMVNNGRGCVTIGLGGGTAFGNNSFASGVGTVTAGTVVGVAIDLTARNAWFRRNNLGWMSAAGGSQDPVTGQGGIAIGTGSFSPTVGFDTTGSGTGDNFTANFGATAFVNAAPSGFGNWPA